MFWLIMRLGGPSPTPQEILANSLLLFLGTTLLFLLVNDGSDDGWLT